MNGQTPWGFQEFQMQEAVHKRQQEQQLADALRQQQVQTVANPLQGLATVLREFLITRPQAAKKDAASVKKLVKALNSPETKQFILGQYKGAIVPAF